MLFTLILLSHFSRILLEIDNPNPVPPNFLLVEASSCTKDWNISNKILEKWDSKINVNSIHGEGSNFNFTIVFEIPESSKKIKQKSNISTKSKKFKADKFSQKISILIVEDNTINMLLCTKMIQSILHNCTIFHAENGEKALKIVDKELIDLILLDIQMPKKNGYDTTLEIRKKEKLKKIPIIALTAGIMVGEKEKCLECGMNDYISKPFKLIELQTIINKYI